MIEVSPEIVVVIMFLPLITAILLGFPLAFSLLGIAFLVGMVAWGSDSIGIIYTKFYGLISNYIILAAPLFIGMGLMIERSGVATRVFDTLYIMLGSFRGGLAIITILLGTVLAACVGVIAASVTALALIALPTMLDHGYKKELACGAVCAGGTLGILIPPSVMLVFYGPMANISVGQLFMGAIGPGLLLSALYLGFVAIWSFIKPEVAPAMSATEIKAISLKRKLYLIFTSFVPMFVLIVSVLGSIFLGIATPTEAAAVGFFVATIMAAAYKQLNWRVIKEVAKDGVVITAMAFFIGGSANVFTGIFLGLGGGDVVEAFVLSTPFGKWGAFIMIQLIIFILGMFINWLGILFIMIPIISPIVLDLGFDPLWFAMMICVNLQMSFMTPPFAYAIFYLQGIKKPEWGLDINHIIRGVVPFVALIVVGLILCTLFPQVILWLPNMMIR
jgi:tripartite ATP-independent transporter DctM subunit